MIKIFVKEYPEKQNTFSKWGELLISYADANNIEFYKLKSVVGVTHALPKDFLLEAKTVLAYFISFD
jgi:hypothetical protein